MGKHLSESEINGLSNAKLKLSFHGKNYPVDLIKHEVLFKATKNLSEGQKDHIIHEFLIHEGYQVPEVHTDRNDPDMLEAMFVLGLSDDIADEIEEKQNKEGQRQNPKIILDLPEERTEEQKNYGCGVIFVLLIVFWLGVMLATWAGKH